MVQEILEQAMEEGRKEIVHGETASYIPELGNVDKNHLGICIYTAGGEVFSAGDTDVRFTIQSISKVISLAAALEVCGFDKVFAKVGMEPSGDAFNSLVKLDLTSDKPFNPMINAGAITTAGYLVPDVSFEDMLNYARRLCLDKDIVMDEKVFRSEMDQEPGHRLPAPEQGHPGKRCGKEPGALYADVFLKRHGREPGRPGAGAVQRRQASGDGRTAH